MKLLATLLFVTAVAAESTPAEPAPSSSASADRAPSAPLVTVWGKAAAEEASGGALLEALRRWDVVKAPPPERFVSLWLRAGGRRIPAFYAPKAHAVAGAAETGGLVWLSLDDDAVRELRPAVERQDPYTEVAAWPLGVKTPIALRADVQAVGTG